MSQLKPALVALFNDLQPNMVAFQGDGLSANPVRWVGTEAGHAPDPCWSTAAYGTYGAGDPNAATWFPAETDFTLQNGDNWFYNPTVGVHSPSDLRSMYEGSAGHGTSIIVDIAPFPNGTVPPAQVQAAASLGSYLQQCYKAPPVATGSGSGYNLTIAPPSPAAVDRVVLAEDLTLGQRIRAYTVTATLTNGTIVQLSSGTSVGSKKIDVLSSPVTVSSVTLQVTTAINTPAIRSFSLFHCSQIAARIDEEWEEWAQATGYVAPTPEEVAAASSGQPPRAWARK